jgi:serine/threonine protein kinase
VVRQATSASAFAPAPTSLEAPRSSAEGPAVGAYAFDPYSPREGGPASSLTRECSERRLTMLDLMSRQLLATYEQCNPGHRFRFKVPRRILTQPKDGVQNDGLDNVEANLICSVGDTLESAKGMYSIVDVLGQGTFGQVFKCQEEGSRRTVAVKVRCLGSSSVPSGRPVQSGLASWGAVYAFGFFLPLLDDERGRILTRATFAVA